MGHDVLILLVRERTRLVEHRFADAERAREDDRVVADARRVAPRIWVLYLKRLGKRLNARQEQLLEAAGLGRDFLLETLAVFAVLDDEPASFEGLADARPDFLEVERLREIVEG